MGKCFVLFSATTSLFFMMVVGSAPHARAENVIDNAERTLAAQVQLEDPLRFLASYRDRTSDMSGENPPLAEGKCDPGRGEVECAEPESALLAQAVTEPFDAPVIYQRDGAERLVQEPLRGQDLISPTVRLLMTYGRDSHVRIHVARPQAFQLASPTDAQRTGLPRSPSSANPFFVVLFAPGEFLPPDEQEAFSSADEREHPPQLSRDRRPARKSYTSLEGNRRPSWKVYAQGY